MADTFTNLSAQYLGTDALPSQRPFVLLLTGALVLLMCFPRNLQALGESLIVLSCILSHAVCRKVVSSTAAAVQHGGQKHLLCQAFRYSMTCLLHWKLKSALCNASSAAVVIAERVSFAAVLGFVYTAVAVLVKGSMVRQARCMLMWQPGSCQLQCSCYC